MADEKTDVWVIRVIMATVVGMYGIFVKHIFNHVGRLELDRKQEKSSCEDIVKRIDGNHEEVCSRLDRILDKLEK